MQLNVLGPGSIAAEVRWFEASRTQVSRRTSRLEVTAEVVLQAQGNSNRVSLFDLSTHGYNAELVERASVGDRMSVKSEGLEVLEADVCWINGLRAGLRFKRPVHPVVLDLLLKRLGVIA